MEPSYQTRKIIGRILALFCAAGLAAAFVAYFKNPLLQHLAARQDTALTLAVFTQPAMRFSYNPSTRKVLVTVAPGKCETSGAHACFDGNFDLFFVPRESVQNNFWSQFKDNLAMWRFNPAPLGNYLYGYFSALIQKRTNVNPAQFAALSLELAELTASDFAVEQPEAKQKKKNKKSEQTAAAPASPVSAPEKPTAQTESQPLKVIILNASGKKGLAESLKQYLRAQYAKGLLQVDVYDTGNYPSLQDHSFIEDYSGRLVQVTQISHAIGITGEIHSQKSTGELYYDSRIVLGKDFKMPL